jgi:hypothetical protein
MSNCFDQQSETYLTISVKKDVERKRLKLQKAQSFVKGDKSDKPYDKARLKFQDEDELGNECIERIILNLYRSSKV